jgi:hypothetical protein
VPAYVLFDISSARGLMFNILTDILSAAFPVRKQAPTKSRSKPRTVEVKNGGSGEIVRQEFA